MRRLENAGCDLDQSSWLLLLLLLDIYPHDEGKGYGGARQRCLAMSWIGWPSHGWRGRSDVSTSASVVQWSARLATNLRARIRSRPGQSAHSPPSCSSIPFGLVDRWVPGEGKLWKSRMSFPAALCPGVEGSYPPQPQGLMGRR